MSTPTRGVTMAVNHGPGLRLQRTRLDQIKPYKHGFSGNAKAREGLGASRARHKRSYLSSTLAPASSSFFLASSAPALSRPSLTGLGAPSTRSLASFRPRPVISRTALITETLFEPTSARTTVNSVCSSAAAAPPPAAAGAATATAAAAADTPNFSSISLISSDSSSTVMPAMASRISALLSAIFQELQIGNARVWLSLRSSEFRLGCPSGGLFLVAHGGQAAHELGRNFVERTYELRDRGLQGAQQLREQLFTGRHGGQGLHAGFVQQAVGQRAALDDQLVVALCETGKHLGRRHRILADRIDQRAGQLCRQRLESRVGDSATSQRVLQDTQVHTRFTRSLAQYGDRGDVQTTVLGDDDRLGLGNLRRDFLDDHRFLLAIETHGLNTPSKDACGPKA